MTVSFIFVPLGPPIPKPRRSLRQSKEIPKPKTEGRETKASEKPKTTTKPRIFPQKPKIHPSELKVLGGKVHAEKSNESTAQQTSKTRQSHEKTKQPKMSHEKTKQPKIPEVPSVRTLQYLSYK